ncbi:MAG: SHD1 domain-containing protein [Akkermansiaceae bacterium]|nr:SHD1 domain-containing protein [Akkermansiaceae bacterium]
MPRPLTILALCLSLTGLIPSALGGEVRIWTNNDGVEIEASYVRASETQVTLKMKSNGKEYEVPLSHLSESDVDYVKAQRAARAAAGAEEEEAALEFENWDRDWPKLISGNVSPEIEIVEENEEAKRFVYHSPRYEFICDVELSKSVVKRFAVLFEATNEYVRELPLSMAKAHRDKRHKILLFETKESYFRNGGPQGSAGVYMSRNDVIMVPLTSLGVEKGAGGYRVDHDKTNKTLPHEILHQLTDMAYFAPGSMGWFTEGLAEYVAVTPYRSGKFIVRGNQRAIEEYVAASGEDNTGGRALGREIKVPDLRAFMLQDYGSFTGNANFNYGIGLLITYYFCHWDGDEEAKRLKSFLKGLKQGKRGDEALELLLDGRSWDEMEKEIAKAWSPRGINLEFQ